MFKHFMRLLHRVSSSNLRLARATESLVANRWTGIPIVSFWTVGWELVRVSPFSVLNLILGKKESSVVCFFVTVAWWDTLFSTVTVSG